MHNIYRKLKKKEKIENRISPVIPIMHEGGDSGLSYSPLNSQAETLPSSLL